MYIFFIHYYFIYKKNVKSCNRQSDVLINRIGTRASNDRYNEVSTTFIHNPLTYTIDITLVKSNKRKKFDNFTLKFLSISRYNKKYFFGFCHTN